MCVCVCNKNNKTSLRLDYHSRTCESGCTDHELKLWHVCLGLTAWLTDWWGGGGCATVVDRNAVHTNSNSYTTDIPYMLAQQQHSLDHELNWNSSSWQFNQLSVCGSDTQQKPLLTTEDAQMLFTSSQGQRTASHGKPHFLSITELCVTTQTNTLSLSTVEI